MFGIFKKQDKKPNNMKEKLKNMIIDSVNSWTEKDIYAISLFMYDCNDNPCKPTVTLGYNTETQFKENESCASSKNEARWNYAFWLQNCEFCFGNDETEKDVKDWIIKSGYPFFEDDDRAIFEGDNFEKSQKITKAFTDLLIEIVKEIHSSGELTKKFGKEIPIIIHELEYYDEISIQNTEANGEILDMSFADFCINGI